MNGTNRPPRLAGQTRRQVRNGRRRAAVRAFAGARLWLGRSISPKTQAEAADMVGSNSVYLIAASILLWHDDGDLIEDVLAGRRSLLGAARAVRRKVRLTQAWSDATADDRAMFGRTVGVAEVFDAAVAPSL